MNYVFLTTVLVLMLSSCSNKEAEEKLALEKTKQDFDLHHIVGIGKIIPEKDIVQLSSPVNGIVQKLFKQENDTVHVGTVILELDHQIEDETTVQLGNQLTTQATQMNMDEASVNEYVARLSNAQLAFQRLENLLAKGAETQQTIDDASTNLKVLSANLSKLRAAVNVSKSKLNETKTAFRKAQLEVQQKRIQSPVDGRILELTVLIGGAVSLQQSIAQLSPFGKTIAICEIDESNASKIRNGQKGWIRNVGSSDTLSTGTVFFTSSFLKKKSLFTDQSGEKEDRRVRTIKLLLDTPDQLLLNARVECVIDISNSPKK